MKNLKQRTPILNIDVWKHAYYFNYQKKHADYIEIFFNVINWDKVTQWYEDAIRLEIEWFFYDRM